MCPPDVCHDTSDVKTCYQTETKFPKIPESRSEDVFWLSEQFRFTVRLRLNAYLPRDGWFTMCQPSNWHSINGVKNKTNFSSSPIFLSFPSIFLSFPSIFSSSPSILSSKTSVCFSKTNYCIYYENLSNFPLLCAAAHSEFALQI